MKRYPALCVAVLLAVITSPDGSQAEDWARFRGPGGAATSDAKGLPVAWGGDGDRAKNIVWSAPLPGHGASSPIVVGGRVFLTCYSGYGIAEKQGREEDLTRHLLCFDVDDGKRIWQKDLPAALPEASYESFLRVHGYASHTPTSDGERLYVFLGKSGVYAFDLEGKELWHKRVGIGITNWGSGASPVLVGDLVVVNASLERRTMYAFDKKTGEPMWRIEKVNSSWSTPVLADAPGGKKELVFYIHRKVAGFDPTTGEELWMVDADEDSSYAAPSPVAADGIVYAYVGGGELVAIRTGGRGNVSKSHVLWRAGGVASGITSPAIGGGLIYCQGNNGVFACVDAKTGEVVYKERLPRGAAYSSPLVGDGKVYAVTREGGTCVIEAGRKFRLLARNHLDDSIFNASPAVHKNRLLLRSNQSLYCIGAATTD